MVWKFFTSIKLTVILLLTLAATSIVGTLIPQNEDPAAYVQAYGDFVFRLFSTLGIFDMYHSWWFQGLLLLPIRFPSFDKMRRGELIISVAELKQRFYTGLQVTSDPGVWLVYMGFIVMVIGCYITFFMFHQQFCVEVVEKSNYSRIIVSGKANKNKLGVRDKVKKISEKLTNMQPQTKGHKPKAIRSGAQSAGHRA
jgi:cytochrome c biogenesis protein ResB